MHDEITLLCPALCNSLYFVCWSLVVAQGILNHDYLTSEPQLNHSVLFKLTMHDSDSISSLLWSSMEGHHNNTSFSSPKAHTHRTMHKCAYTHMHTHMHTQPKMHVLFSTVGTQCHTCTTRPLKSVRTKQGRRRRIIITKTASGQHEGKTNQDGAMTDPTAHCKSSGGRGTCADGANTDDPFAVKADVWWVYTILELECKN